MHSTESCHLPIAYTMFYPAHRYLVKGNTAHSAVFSSFKCLCA